jgi:hypothetical protein
VCGDFMRIDSTLQLLTTLNFIVTQIISTISVSIGLGNLLLRVAVLLIINVPRISLSASQHSTAPRPIPSDPSLRLSFSPASMRVAPSRSPTPRCPYYLNKPRKHFPLLVVLTRRPSLPSSFCSRGWSLPPILS